ncbi:hypothetical protein BGZ82_002311, partial [Podila clonocystis]
MATKVEGGVIHPATGCAVVHERQDMLMTRVQRAHLLSRARVVCSKSDCRKTFGLLPELKRRRAKVHSSGPRYCPCLDRWFARRSLLIDHCPHRENCP